jgi:hypothetical protein
MLSDKPLKGLLDSEEWDGARTAQIHGEDDDDDDGIKFYTEPFHMCLKFL